MSTPAGRDGLVVPVTDVDLDPVEGLRGRLRDLFVRARRPTYRTLGAHADREGRTLRASTVSGLLNGPTTPRWETVETFVRACARYASAHQIELAPDLGDVDRWHTAYRTMENDVADRAARGERVAGRAGPTRRWPGVPAQLPAGTTAFTGRGRQLAELDQVLPGTGVPGSVTICAIVGTAGIGKTTLAVHWAHRVRHRFPDGQLYVNLRGFDAGGQATDPAAAVRGFLDALGVPPQRIPGGLDAQAALYRSLLVDRRVLIVLDNARDTAQVRPLLPAAPGCLVVVTSRNQLTGLVAAHDARPVTLDLLGHQEAHDLLAHRLGPERLDAEPEAVGTIIRSCARLPLALSQVAATTVMRPHIRLAHLGERLQDAGQRWPALAGDGAAGDIRAVFSWSCEALTPAAARLFRLFGLHPGPDISAQAAASLAGVPATTVRPLLDELLRASLVTEGAPGRYALHDLLHAYAADQAEVTDPQPERRAATQRLLDHYLHSAQRADDRLHPHRGHRSPIAPGAPAAGVAPEDHAGPEQALAWFALELPVLLGTIGQAVDGGFRTSVLPLAWRLAAFLDRQTRGNGRATAHHVIAGASRWGDDRAARAVELRRELTDRNREARTHAELARWLVQQEAAPHQALDHAQQALRLYWTTRLRAAEAGARGVSDWCRTYLGDHQQSLAHAQQGLALLQEIADRRGQAMSLQVLGQAQHHFGHPRQAAMV